MWNVCKGTIVVLARTRVLLIWALAFPLLLSTLFSLMFANLDSVTSFRPVPTAVVADGDYRQAAQFSSTIDALSKPGDSQMLDVRTFATMDEARSALAHDEVAGILSIDADGNPLLSMPSVSSGEAGEGQINQTILHTLVNTYVTNDALLTSIGRDDPSALSDPAAIRQATAREEATEHVSLTRSAPSQTVRYYYTLLGMACLYCSFVGLMAICKTQPNLTALGARQAIGGVSRARMLAATLAASWVIAFSCLLVAFLYMRFALGVDFAGREGACIAALGVAALFAVSFGTLLGSLPKINMHVKTSLSVIATLMLSLFAGLFGTPSMDLADKVARSFPTLAAINPARVVADTFYSLYYYDSLAAFFGKIGILLIMTVVLFAISSLFIRRQRYASL